MDDISYPVKIINGVPVITPPSEIDRTNAYQLRLTLLQAAGHGHTTIAVDMTQTRFCDSSGLTVLVHAHKRALAEGGELRLVIPAGGAVFRIFTLTSLDRVIPHFPSLNEALLQGPGAVIIPLRRRRRPGLPPRPSPGASSPDAGECEPLPIGQAPGHPVILSRGRARRASPQMNISTLDQMRPNNHSPS